MSERQYFKLGVPTSRADEPHMLDWKAKARAEREHRANQLASTCCNGNCRQGRECPHMLIDDAVHIYPQPAPEPRRKPLRLSADVLQLGTRRSPVRKIRAAMRGLWRYLTGPAPW